MVTFIKISDKEYNDSLQQSRDLSGDSMCSPDGVLLLNPVYAGNFLRGDNLYYAEIQNKETGKVIWEYKSGKEIRDINHRPWSNDSLSCYFEIVEKGDRIVRYDRQANSIACIFENSERLNSICFVPRNINGVILLSYPYHKQIGEDWQFYCYLKEKDKLISINKLVGENSPIYVHESFDENTVIVVTLTEINIVDIDKGLVTYKALFPFRLYQDTLHWNSFMATDENYIYMRLYLNEDNRDVDYYKINYGQHAI